MGGFNVKSFLGGLFSEVDDFDETNESENYDIQDEDMYVADEEPSNEIEYGAEEPTFVQEPAPAPAMRTPVVQQNATVVMLSPYDIRTSQIVCDHVRDGHIVICYISGSTDKSQRVVDYICGGVYALGGRLEPTPIKSTFVCTPKSVDLIVENTDAEATTKVSAL